MKWPGSPYSFRLFVSDSSCARVFTPSLSLNCHSTAAFIWSPRQLLQSDTGDPHFALDPLTYRCLLSLSPAADFAEPRPPRHKLIGYFKEYCFISELQTGLVQVWLQKPASKTVCKAGLSLKTSQVTYVTMVPRVGNETLRPLGVATGNALSVTRSEDTYVKTPPVGRRQPMTSLPACHNISAAGSIHHQLLRLKLASEAWPKA